jgi:hypothetical protein
MLLSEAEREHKINAFLTRKFREFNIDSEVPAATATTHSLNARSMRA